MVRKSLTILIIISLSLSMLSAAVNIKGGADLTGGWMQQGNRFIYSASPYLAAQYSASSVKAEVRIAYDINSITGNGVFSLDRASIRFRFPSFENTKMTVSAGRFPISWGMGSYYRAGDVLFSDPVVNEEIGTMSERSRWAVTISQPLVKGLVLEGAFLPPLAENAGGEVFGALLRYSFKNDWIKEARASYSYSRGDNRHKAAFLLDASMYFDIIVGVESTFTYADDVRILLDVKKAYSVDTDTGSHQIIAYLSSEADIHAGRYNIMPAVSIGVSDRTTLMFMHTSTVTDWKYSFSVGSSVTVKLLDELKAGVYILVSGPDELNTTAGVQLKFAF